MLILAVLLAAIVVLVVGSVMTKPPEPSCGGLWQDGVCII